MADSSKYGEIPGGRRREEEEEEKRKSSSKRHEHEDTQESDDESKRSKKKKKKKSKKDRRKKKEKHDSASSSSSSKVEGKEGIATEAQKRKKKLKKKPKKKIEDLWVKLLKAQMGDVDEKTKGTSDRGEDTDIEGSRTAKSNVQESSIVFVGSRGSGKSTLINAFLNSTNGGKDLKPTAALEYLYGRRAIGNDKQLVHVWEVGGGVKMQELLQSVIKKESLSTMTAVIVLDMSEPGCAVVILRRWLDILDRRVNKCKSALRAAFPERVRRMERLTRARYGDNSDLESDLQSLVAVPVIVVLSKYDDFLKEGTLKRRVVSQAIRSIAHVRGATVVGYDRSSKSTSMLRSMLSHAAFDSKKDEDEGKTEDAVVVKKKDNGGGGVDGRC
eukprot:g3629.t1